MRHLLRAADTFRLFVYGTLKRGGCRHGPLAAQRCLGDARTTPTYALFHLGDYPGLVPCPADGSTVHGELYDVETALLDWLDAVEGAPDWFDLRPIDLDGIPGPVFAYYYQGDPSRHPRIESGTWANP